MTRLLIPDTAAAEMLDVHRATIWRYAASGILPRPIKVGGSARWYVSEIEEAVAKLAAQQREQIPDEAKD